MAAMVAEQRGIQSAWLFAIYKLMLYVSPPRERDQWLASGYYITQ
jgi:hypothetical protein